jgi:hypothetical protein
MFPAITRQRPELDNEERDLFDAIVKCAELSANEVLAWTGNSASRCLPPSIPNCSTLCRHVAELGKEETAKEETTICEFCRKGHVIQHLEDIAFRQWSDIGWISCRVAVSIDVCDVCNAKTLRGGDKILEEAFQREYDKAANSSRSRRAA